MSLWVMLVVLSARYPAGNLEGGVAAQVVEFQTESLCRQAAKEFLTVNDGRGFFVSATCVQRAR